MLVIGVTVLWREEATVAAAERAIITAQEDVLPLLLIDGELLRELPCVL